MKKKTFTWVIVLVSIGVIGAIGAAFFIGFQLDGSASDPLMGMTPVTVEQGDLEQLVFADGVVEPEVTRSIFPKSTGVVIELVSKENDGVSAEDVVAKIETTNAFGNTETEDVLTPIAGTILEIPVTLDQVVTTQVPMMSVADLSNLQIVMFVDESDVTLVKEGQRVNLEFSSLPDADPVTGVVTFVALWDTTTPGATASQYKVIVKPDTVPEGVLIGMSADVEIVVDERTDVVFIDTVYLFTEDGNDYVNLVRPATGGYDRVPVELGFEGETEIEITAGLSSGDRIVLPFESDLPAEEAFGFGPQ